MPAAVVFGLGCLIRPELVLGSAILLAALLMLARPKEGGSRWKQGAVLLLAALAVPLAYELFRMAYYALVVPSTALAKAAGASWWSQGATYLWNLLAPYTLWLPLALAVPVVFVRTSAWWRAGDRRGVLLVATPLVVGAADVLYVVHLGGDYMHARLLLPGLFALLLPVWVDLGQLRGVLVVPVVGIVVWAVVCAGWLRFVPPKIAGLTPQTVFISNERNSWITATGEAHPVTAGDYRRALSGAAAASLIRLSRAEPAGRNDAGGRHEPLPPDRHGRDPPGAVRAAVLLGGQPSRDRRDRLPGRSERLRLRRVLAGQPRRQPHHRRPPRATRPREVHRPGLDAGPVRCSRDRARGRRAVLPGHRRGPGRARLQPLGRVPARGDRSLDGLAGRRQRRNTRGASPPSRTAPTRSWPPPSSAVGPPCSPPDGSR